MYSTFLSWDKTGKKRPVPLDNPLSADATVRRMIERDSIEDASIESPYLDRKPFLECTHERGLFPEEYFNVERRLHRSSESRVKSAK